MNKKSNLRLLSFLLAMVMIFGSISPAFAAGLEGPYQPKQKFESELVSKNGKLRGKLLAPKKEQSKKSFAGLFRAPAKEPSEFDETTVKVNIIKHGIGTNEFNFKAVFGDNPDTKIWLNNDAEGANQDRQEAVFSESDKAVTFTTPIPMKNVADEEVWIEFEGTHVTGRLVFQEDSHYHSGENNTTIFNLDLYQIRNTDVVVTTKTADGTVVANPTTGKIKLGSLDKEINIPAQGKTGIFDNVENISIEQVENLNSDPNYSVEGLVNGELVDSVNNKVYIPGRFIVDPDGIKPTTIEFTEKQAGCKRKDELKADFEKAANAKFDEIKSKDGVYSAVYDADKHKVTVTILDKTQKFNELSGTGLVAGLFELKEKNNVVAVQIGAQDRINLPDGLDMNNFSLMVVAGIGTELNNQGVPNLQTLEDFAGKTVAVKLYIKEAGCDNEVSVIYYITGQLNNSDKDIIPYEPKDPQNPTDENDPNIPKKDKDGKDIVPSDFVRVAFKVDPNPSGTLTFDNVVEKSVISALVRITKPQKKWADFTMPTTNDTETYKFLKWEMPTNTVVADGDVAVAKFIKNGDKIDPKDTVPEGVHKVTLQQGIGVEDNEKYATYAVFDGKTLEEAGIAFDPVAKKGFEKAGWLDSDNKVVANLGEVVVNEDKTFVASAIGIICYTEDGLQEQFEEAANPMFAKVGSKEGVYIGHFDEANKEVTVYIIDKTKDAKQITGTGLIAGLTTLYKNNYLTKIKVGNQDERDLKALAEAAPGMNMTVAQMFKFVIGADLLNAVQAQGNTGKLADFINKTVVLKLTIEQAGCNNPVTVEYTVNGKEAAASKLKDKLDPQDISVWVGDNINWNDGVKLKEENADLQALLDKATVTDLGENGTEEDPKDERTSSAKGKFTGNLLVTFEDGSKLVVENQDLYVREEKEEITDNNEDWPLPKDGLEVQFKAGEGIKKEAEDKDLIKTVLYKAGTKLVDADFPKVELETGYTEPAKWTGNGSGEGFIVSETNNVFTANAAKKGDIIEDTTPDTDDDKPKDYVTVKFLAGDHGSLEGPTKFYVNPKAGVKNSDLTEPTIKANIGYKVADPKWNPEFAKETEIKEDATYTAQYTKLGDIINSHDDNGGEVEKPEGYVTVRFLVDKNGTLDGETVFYVNPEAKKTMKEITPPTIKVKDEYIEKGYKVGDPNWEPDLTNDTTPITKDRFYVANFDCDHTNPNEFEITYISMDTEMGTVNPELETVKTDINAENEAGKIKGSTATANKGYKFVKWIDTEGKQVSTDAKFVPTERKTATYIAVFEKEEEVTPEPTDFTIKYISMDTKMGTVSPSEEVVAIKGGEIKGSTATANKGYKFVKWIDIAGNKVSEKAKIVPTLKEEATYIAIFEKVEPVEPKPTEFTIKYIPVGNDMGTVSPQSETVAKDGGVINGSTATPRDGYKFVRWMDKDGKTVSTSAKFIPNDREAANYYAIFAKKQTTVLVPDPIPCPNPDKPEPKPEKPETDRTSGKDRIETGIEVSKKYFDKSKIVIIADEKDFPDSMTASVLSKILRAPILLTNTNKLDPRVEAEIKRLGAEDVIIVGGVNSISEKVAKELANYDKDTVERLAGKDRYETSAEVARRVVGLTGQKGYAVIASGEVFADALTIGAFAAREEYPILLVKKNEIPESINKAFKELGIKNVYLAGGVNTVSEKVAKDLPGLIERIAGEDRFETAVKIAKEKFAGRESIFLANGQVFADALVISPVAGLLDMPILLTNADTAPKTLTEYIEEENIKAITAVGGQRMVSDKVLEELIK